LPTSPTGRKDGRAPVVERLVREADRIVGLYDGERQIGFARAFTDGTSLAYLADVYVLAPYRGRGLGAELVREMVENGPFVRLRWLLHTRDAHGLYRRFGFDTPSERMLERAPA
jgi:GNAT superfamily N-acetyltransferase